MTGTATMLYKTCLRDEMPSLPEIADYFGNARAEKDIVTVLGIYQGLVKMKGVKAPLLANCFLSNRLNELVHAKYKHGQSGYYKMFCQSKIDLKTKTGLEPLPKRDWLPIYDDDHCPNCDTKGYISLKFKDGLIDCSKCFNMMCKHCVQENSSRCKTCHARPVTESDDDSN